MKDEEYQRTAKALARETKMSEASAARIEQKLLDAVEDHEIAVSQPFTWLPPSASARSATARPPEPWRRQLGGRKQLAAAAALVLIAGSISLWNAIRTTVDPTAPVTEVAAEKPSFPQEVAPAPKPVVVTSAKAPPIPRATRPVQRAHTARVIRPAGFVELPWSAGLPAFESGEIVRMEVPMATLPTYGIDISAGPSGGPVEADVLIGQDGFARAIRLVTSAVRSTQ